MVQMSRECGVGSLLTRGRAGGGCLGVVGSGQIVVLAGIPRVVEVIDVCFVPPTVCSHEKMADTDSAGSLGGPWRSLW